MKKLCHLSFGFRILVEATQKYLVSKKKKKKKKKKGNGKAYNLMSIVSTLELIWSSKETIKDLQYPI